MYQIFFKSAGGGGEEVGGWGGAEQHHTNNATHATRHDLLLMYTQLRLNPRGAL